MISGRPGKGRYNQAVFYFMVLLFAFLVVTDFFIVRHQRNFLLTSAKNQAKRDLQLMGSFVLQPLLEHDYAWVDQFMSHWGEEHEEVIELSALSPSGVVLVKFQRSGPENHVFRVTHRVAFLGKDVVVLDTMVSYRSVQEMLQKLRLRLFVISFCLMVFAGAILWWTLKRLALAPLEMEIEGRKQAEQELQKARDRLEERVLERTLDLENANLLLKKEIRERKATETRLANLHRQNEMILNAAGEGIYGVDVSGCFAFINKAALEMFGYSDEEELVGAHLHDFNHHLRWDGVPYPAEECPVCASFFEGKEHRGSDKYFGRRDGSVFPVEHVSTPIIEDGVVIGTVVVFVDITERKRTERELLELTETLEQRVLERTARLDSANVELKETLGQLQDMQEQLVQTEKMAALGDLVAGVAHEINTPVGIGVTAASHLEKTTRHFSKLYERNAMKRSDLDNYFRTCLDSSELILSNLDRAAELIRSFKQVATDQSGEARRRFKMKAYIQEVLLSLRPILKKTRHHVTIRCADDLELTSYPGAFSQIITNFITNSVVHAYEENEEGHLVFWVTTGTNTLTFRYSDDGKGISKENLAHIFDPFYTSNREKGGSGLGLHIAYNIVTQKLGGTIECQSKFGRGATFVFTIPMALPEGNRRNDK